MSANLRSEARSDIVDLMKRRGEITVDDAVEAVDLAKTTVRQHLKVLEEQELIERRSEAHGRGRPRAYFRLSAAAERLYPSRDGIMLRDLLDYLLQEGHLRLVDDFFRTFWEDRGEDFRERLTASGVDDDLEGRLGVLEAFLREQGFMPEMQVDEEGQVVVRECNCPFSEAVKATRLPCRLEAEFLQEATGQTSTRVEYMPDGNPACTYAFDGGKEDG